MKASQNPWILVINDNVYKYLKDIKHILFDFDGTLSVLRRGWEDVMLPVMLKAICGDNDPSDVIEHEVRDYIDKSTGILTIEQMQWLEKAVIRYGITEQPLSAYTYKKIYLNNLMKSVNKRIKRIEIGEIAPNKMMISGAKKFIEYLTASGYVLYLASGTDHSDVVHEVSVLGLDRYFESRIYGALEKSDQNHKERIIRRILDQNQIKGYELLVVGDGPVEIREAKERNAIALGVASDEVKRMGWNERKIKRLKTAQADMIISDFTNSRKLIDLFKGN